MDNPYSHEHVELIREVFHYTRRFKNSTFVIKIDSPVISDAGFPVLCRDLALLQETGIRIIIIPGARERIDEILDRFSIKWELVNGTRIASDDAIPFIKMAAFDVANKVMTSLASGKANAVIGNWVRARAKGVIEGVDFISAGAIEKVDTDVIRNIMAQGMIPIFPCIGWSSLGKPYNVSSDELSATIAEAIQAEKLFFVHRKEDLFSELLGREYPGVVVNKNRISRIDAACASNLKLKNEEEKRFLEIAVHACKAGVDRVHFINGSKDGDILREIYSNQGSGTLVHANPYESIRPMISRDIAGVLAIMNPLISAGMLVSRSREELAESYRDYIVFELDGTIHGCAALHPFSDGSAEIAGLAVDQSYKHVGIGRQMVRFFMEQAAARNYKKIFVFTTQSEDWFQQFGFVRGSKKDLPPEREYNEKRNSKIFVYTLS